MRLPAKTEAEDEPHLLLALIPARALRLRRYGSCQYHPGCDPGRRAGTKWFLTGANSSSQDIEAGPRLSDQPNNHNGDARPEGTAQTKSRVALVIAIAVGVALVVLIGALFISPSKDRGPAVPVFADDGGAPSGTPTGYVKVPGAPDPASTGKFENRAGDGSPLHRDAGLIFLGISPGSESTARPNDLTQTTDDGLVIPWGFATAEPAGVVDGLAPCSDNRVVIGVDTEKLPDSLVGQTAYVNLFFDWDRNGRYEGNDGCADEWAAKNVALKLDRKESIGFPVKIRAGRQTMDFWHRTVLSVDERLDSVRPPTALKYGETEDAHWINPEIRRLGDPKPPEEPDTCADFPPTVVKSKTRSLIKVATGASGTRPGVDFPSVHGAGDSGADARIVDFRSTLGVAPARSSAWLELALGERSGVSTGRIEFEIKGRRLSCKYFQLGEDTLADGALGPLSNPSLPSQSKSGTENGLSAIHCPYGELIGGETARLQMQDFSASPGLAYSLAVSSQPSDSSATAEGLKIVVAAAVPPKSAASTWQVLLSDGTNERTVDCSTTVIGKLPQRSQASVAPPTAGGREPQPTMVSFGSYKVRFAKKTDSCGNYPLRQEETVQVRPAPKNQIEFHRPATGNKSTGNLNTSDSSFLATGSGTRKDGRSYVEQYLGKFNGLNISGSYDLQEGECRATFTFEGSRA
ncbi:MAG: hypothetical protein DCC49_13320 [Acidobacteria bacterium]|nr:MAG: hypothetical protein DCC49_13320 [Acidobacteriota bacterium]